RVGSTRSLAAGEFQAFSVYRAASLTRHSSQIPTGSVELTVLSEWTLYPAFPSRILFGAATVRSEPAASHTLIRQHLCDPSKVSLGILAELSASGLLRSSTSTSQYRNPSQCRSSEVRENGRSTSASIS